MSNFLCPYSNEIKSICMYHRRSVLILFKTHILAEYSPDEVFVRYRATLVENRFVIPDVQSNFNFLPYYDKLSQNISDLSG